LVKGVGSRAAFRIEKEAGGEVAQSFMSDSGKKGGYSGADVAHFLGINDSAVNRLAVSDEYHQDNLSSLISATSLMLFTMKNLIRGTVYCSQTPRVYRSTNLCGFRRNQPPRDPSLIQLQRTFCIALKMA